MIQQRAQRIPVRDDQHVLAGTQVVHDVLLEIRQHALDRHRQALSLLSRRPHVEAAAPDVHLLRSVLLRHLRLVQSLQVAVVALVERLVHRHRHLLVPGMLERDRRGAHRALERRCVHRVDLHAAQLDAGRRRLLFAERREVDILPAGEPVLEVPLRLAVAEKYELGHRCGRIDDGFGDHSCGDSGMSAGSPSGRYLIAGTSLTTP